MLLVATIVTLGGCSRDPYPGLENPEELTLYSIDGRDFQPGQEPKVDEKFHGYPVLGKLKITDAGKRKEIAAALQDAMAKSDGTMNKCFWPRHAIRVKVGDRTVDYVICFECLQLELHPSTGRTAKAITRDPQPLFNHYLEEASVPLAPGAKGKKG
jgi:hypothetical protein